MNVPEQTVLPDLYAGELAAMGRLLTNVSGELARYALRALDLCAECSRAAAALEALADRPPLAGSAEGRELVDVALALRAALAKGRVG
jgi:hypothetical protein